MTTISSVSSTYSVVSLEGNYYLAHFDEKNGGECKKVLEKKLTDRPAPEF